MSLHRVEDQQFKRVLQYLGLRGVVNHDYESTVLPVVVVGEPDSNAMILRESAANIVLGNAIFTVPTDQTWEIFALSGQANQTGGAVAFRWGLSWFDLPSGATIQLPFHGESDTPSLALSMTHTLNTARRWAAVTPPGLTVGPGMILSQLNLAGDGSRVMFQANLLYRLVEPILTVIQD